MRKNCVLKARGDHADRALAKKGARLAQPSGAEAAVLTGCRLAPLGKRYGSTRGDRSAASKNLATSPPTRVEAEARAMHPCTQWSSADSAQKTT